MEEAQIAEELKKVGRGFQENGRGENWIRKIKDWIIKIKRNLTEKRLVGRSLKTKKIVRRERFIIKKVKGIANVGWNEQEKTGIAIKYAKIITACYLEK